MISQYIYIMNKMNKRKKIR